LDQLAEDTDAVFFDANGNGFLDLIVTSGSSEAAFGTAELADRLYLNNGKGKFTKAERTGLESFRYSSSVVKVLDVNGDGAMDLFVGGRLIPFVYGVNASSFILVNDGQGNFKDATAEFAPQIKEIVLVTDAAIVDYDGDGKEDLILVGEWMAPTFFKNMGKQLEKIEMPEMQAYKGWYRTLEVGDFNKDGKPDFVLGNHGLNSRFKPTDQASVSMFVNDFDQNGSVEQIYTLQSGDRHIPYTLKHELEKQIPILKKKYLKYSTYNKESMEDIFGTEALANSVVQEFNFASSAIMMNKGAGQFEIQALPRKAQRSWMFAALVTDVNGDGIQDIIMAGNLAGAKPEVGQYDASYGEVLIGKGDGTFDYLENRNHGLKLEGDIRGLHEVQVKGQRMLMVVKNNKPLEWWAY
jgi:hypothetical protein